MYIRTVVALLKKKKQQQRNQPPSVQEVPNLPSHLRWEAGNIEHGHVQESQEMDVVF